MISRSTGIAYDPDATCPRWKRFLAEVFAGDEELVDWIGLLVGASAVGVGQGGARGSTTGSATTGSPVRGPRSAAPSATTRS